MLHSISLYLVAAAFFGAGAFNAVGTDATRADFVRWGYPSWWCRPTGGSEIAAAIMIVLPATRGAGLILGAIVVAAAALTILWHREISHSPPVIVFAVLLALPELIA